MAPRRKEHSSNYYRLLAIRHFENDDSYATITKKTLMSRSTKQRIIKKSTKKEKEMYHEHERLQPKRKHDSSCQSHYST